VLPLGVSIRLGLGLG